MTIVERGRPNPLTAPPRIGAHVSGGAPLSGFAARATAIGAECAQVFLSGPQSWRPSAHDPATLAAAADVARTANIAPVLLHAIYLINLATPDETAMERSVTSLVEYLRLGAILGVAGVVVHPGSHRGEGFAAALPRLGASLRRALAESPPTVPILLENSAGQGGTVGSSFEELAAMLNAAHSDRVRICLDTCHLFGAGYDLRDEAAVHATLAAFDREVGLPYLAAVHANDSKTELGSGRDRHENIGAGKIGLAGFRALLTHPALSGLPVLLEVPGFAGGGPDIHNIEILKALRDGREPPSPPVATPDATAGAESSPPH